MDLCVKHPYGMAYPVIPFLWNYDDFSNPFRSYFISSHNKKSFINIINSENVALNREIESLTDASTQFAVHVQYKQEDFLYEGDQKDIYLGYHAWCYYGKYNNDTLMDKRDMFFFNTGIYSLDGELNPSMGYPNKGTYKKNKPGGIEINTGSKQRCATIHKLQNVMRFSSINICNFYSDDENIAFVSVGKYFNDKDKNPITVNGKNNVVVLHILRNKADNNAEDDDFIALLNKYKSYPV